MSYEFVVESNKLDKKEKYREDTEGKSVIIL